MGFNKLQKKILTIAANLGIICLSGIAAATSTVAWFNFTNTKTAAGMSIRCSSYDHNVMWNILKYDEELKAGIETHDERDFFLPSYDQYITDKNLYSNVILKATVLTPVGYNDDDQLYIDITCSGDLKIGDSIVPVTSNLCEFKATVYSSTTIEGETELANAAIDDTNIDTQYRSASSFFDSTSSSSYSFVNINADTPMKDRDKKITVMPRFNVGDVAVKQFIIFLECSYKPQLVDYYVAQLGDSLSDREIELNGDITEIEFRFGKRYTGAYKRISSASGISPDEDYMITYENYNVAFDGSGTMANHYRTGQNYIPIEINRNMIRNNETVHNSDFKITQDNGLHSRAGWNVGGTSALVSKGMVASQDTEYQHSYTYTGSGTVDAVSNEKHLRYSPVKDNTNFNYYLDGSDAEARDVQFYKYEDSDEANSTLDSILISGTYATNFILGEPFNHDGMVVTAYYKDPQGNITSSVVTNKCAFTGYNMGAATAQTVNVSYTEDGVTVVARYNITVTTGPTVTVTPSILIGLAGDIGQLKARLTFFPDPEAVTFTWEVNDMTVASVDETNGDSTNVYYNKAGYCTITCTASDGVNTDVSTVNVRVTGEISDADTYIKVTSQSQLEAGQYLIVYETGSLIFNGALSTLDVGTNNIPVTIKDNQISATTDVNNAAFTLADDGSGGWKISNQAGTFVGRTQAKNGMDTSSSWSSSLSNTITIDETTFAAQIRGTGGYCLRYNASSGSTNSRFRYYASTSQQPVALYKKVGNSSNLRLVKIDPRGTLRTEFYRGDIFEFGPGVSFIATFNNNSRRDVTSGVIHNGSELTKSVGTHTVVVSFEYNGFTASYEYTINVLAPTLLNITLRTDNATTQFDKGTAFSSQGLEVIAHYSNGSSANVYEDCNITGYPEDVTTALGEYIITVTYREGGFAKTATYTVVYVEPTQGWKIVKNASQLTTGDHVVIASYNTNVAISKEQKSNNRGEAIVTKLGDMLDFNSNVAVFDVYVNGDGTYSFYDPANNGYIYAASSSANYLRTEETKDTKGNADWSLTFGSGGVANITAQGNYTRNRLRYNSASKLFSCYTSGQGDVCIYKYSGEYVAPVIHVEQIKTPYSTYNLNVGETTTIVPEVLPSDAANKAVHFMMVNTSVATITDDGVVTGVNAGSTTVIIYSDENESIRTVVNITVVIPHVDVTDVVIDSTVSTMNIGDMMFLFAHVLPANASEQGVIWESEDDNIIEVMHVHDPDAGIDYDNRIKANAAGTVRIYCYSVDNPSIYSQIVITVVSDVVVPVDSVTIDPSTATVAAGETTTLTATVLPATATDKLVTWSTSDDTVATVSGSGLVTGVGPGTATITATSHADGTKTATCVVTVTAQAKYYLVTDASQLVAGSKVIIASLSNALAMSTTQNGNNRGQTTITKNASDSTATISADTCEFTLGKNGNNFTFYDENLGGYLCAASSGSNYLRTKSDLDGNATFAITIASSGDASIVAQGNFTRNTIRYNSGNKIFSCYGSGQQAVCIYQLSATPLSASAHRTLVMDEKTRTLINSNTEVKQLIGFFRTLYFVKDMRFDNGINKTKTSYSFDLSNRYYETNKLVINKMTERRTA